MVYFYTGGAGEGKSYALIEKIKSLSDNNEKICIVVPEQYSYEFDKILYHSLGEGQYSLAYDKNLYRSLGAEKFNHMNAFSFTTLSKEILNRYGDTRVNREYANENKKTIIMSMALNEVYSSPDDNLFYSRQYKKNGFAETMANIITEIKQTGISPSALSEKIYSFSGKLHEKLKDISKIYLSYEKLLAEFGFKDQLDNIQEASHIANKQNYFKDTSVFIDEFESFTGDQNEMLKAIISGSKDVYIGLRTANVNEPEFTLFDTVNKTYRNILKICTQYDKKTEILNFNSGARFKHDDLKFLSRNIFRNNKNRFQDKSENIEIFEARDYYSEVEYVCAGIKHLIYEDKSLKYNDIAIIANNIEDYAPILENAFLRYEIPYFMSIEKGVSHTVTMIYICSLLDIISSDNYKTETILKYLKTNLTEIDLFETSEIENFCYTWDINGKKWCETFIPENENNTEEFVHCEDIRKRIITPLEKLKNEIKGDVTVDKICRCIYNFIRDTKVEDKIKDIISFYTNNNQIYFASEQKKIWDFLIEIIDDLYLTLKDKVMSLKQFNILFKQLLLQAKYSVPPQTLDSVTSASALTARLNSPKVVFLLGVNEGKFPVNAQIGDVFSNDERKSLVEIGFNENKTETDIISNGRLSAYKSLASACEKLYISYPLTSLSGESEYSSSVIGNIENMFPMNNILKHESEISEDYYAVTKKSAYYHLMQNKKNADSSVNAIKKVLEEIPEYKNKIDYVYTRSNQDKIYSLSDRAIMDKLVNFRYFSLSPTSFENYNKCHFMYFCKSCLKLQQRKKVEMDVLNLGTLIHECLNYILSSKSKQEFIELTETELKAMIDKVCNEYKNNLFKNNFKQNMRTDFIYKKIVEKILLVTMHLQEELKNTDFVPQKFEVNINTETGFAPLMIDGENGKIRFGGIVDRIDTYIGDDGKEYIRVIDYKSGKKTIDKLLLNNGIDMQMLLYLFALTQNGKFAGSVPSGVLYAPVTIDYPTAEKRSKKAQEVNTIHINTALCFNGLVLKEDKIIQAMDKTSKGTYLRVTSKTKKAPPVFSLSEEQIEKLREFSKNKILEMNSSLYNGDIEVNPLINDKYNINSCKYCLFSDICDNFPVCKSHDGTEIDTAKIDEIFDDNENDGEEE